MNYRKKTFTITFFVGLLISVLLIFGMAQARTLPYEQDNSEGSGGSYHPCSPLYPENCPVDDNTDITEYLTSTPNHQAAHLQNGVSTKRVWVYDEHLSTECVQVETYQTYQVGSACEGSFRCNIKDYNGFLYPLRMKKTVLCLQ